MPTPEEFVEQCRRYIGVRFHRQGRSRHGMDCAGLPAVAAHDLGISDGAEKIQDYAPVPFGQQLERYCKLFMRQVPYNRLQRLSGQIKPADILLFWVETEGVPRHLGVYSGVNESNRPCMVHSYAQENRGVIEVPINDYWRMRIHSVYRIKEFSE